MSSLALRRKHFEDLTSVCVDLQLCGGQGSSDNHDPGGHHRLRSRPLPSRAAGGVHSQAGLPLEAAGVCVKYNHKKR